MKLLWAFDKNLKWITALGITAQRRLAVMAVGDTVAFLLFLIINEYPACTTDL